MSLKEKAKSYRDIAEECFFPEDLKFGAEQFSQLSSDKEWVPLEVAEEKIQKLRSELEIEKSISKGEASQHRMFADENKLLKERIAEATKILNEFEEKSVYAKGSCLWIKRLREALK